MNWFTMRLRGRNRQAAKQPPRLRPVYDPYPLTPANPFLTLNQLQITVSPVEYGTLTEGKQFFKEDLSYQTALPRYILGRCPICNTPYTERVDTHGLAGWYINGNNSRFVYLDVKFSGALIDHPDSGCEHLFALQTHLNLNGTIPLELKKKRTSMTEYPYVMSKWLTGPIPVVAVIHSLPICRVEEGQFVPRYIVYILSYYSADAPGVWDYIRDREMKTVDRDDFGHALRYMSPGPRAEDFPYWVEQGRLQWLDPTDLTLQSGPPEAFPYTGIKGVGLWYFHRNPPPRKGLIPDKDVISEGPGWLLYS